MTPEQYQLVQHHFLRLRELPNAHRQTELDRLHVVSPLIAGEVFKLLASDTDDETEFLRPILKRPSEVVLETRDDSRVKSKSTKDPIQIGPYRILQKIGEGGHGSVYMAEQTEPIRRRVAVKCVKPGMDSKMILARFEAERQALAMMSHPSIANVIDANTTETGQPYFVMELVHGVPVDQFCIDNQLGLIERLRLFQQVCSAVHHAHRKGIIHRDIKPGNVLVTVESGKPLAKVIDFGIAKAMHMPLTEKTMYTEYGQIVGTLEYMSPEQALMSQTGIDVRSDVYSLGVLLYLLITGQTPLSKNELLRKGIWELKSILQNSQPENPSVRITSQSGAGLYRDHVRSPASWLNRVRGDLDWVTMKALAKEPDLRYDSAAQLSDDIEAYLVGDTVVARPPTLWYRFSKFVSRNHVPVTIATVAGLGIFISFIAVTWGYLESQKNLKAVTDANAEVIEQAAALDREKRRADANAARLTRMLRQNLLESAWLSALDGDAESTRATLADIPRPGFPVRFVESVGQDMALDTMRYKNDGTIRMIAVHPELSRAAILTTDSRLEVWDTRQSRNFLTHQLPPAIYNAICFDQRCENVLVGGGGELQLVQLNSGSITKVFAPGRGGIRAIEFNSSLQRWYVTTGGNFVLTLDARSLKLIASRKLDSRISSLTLSPDHSIVVVGSLDGRLFLLDPTDLEPRGMVVGLKDEIAAFRWVGDQLLAVNQNGAVFEIERPSLDDGDAKSRRPLRQVFQLNAEPFSLHISETGKVFGSWRDGVVGYFEPNSRQLFQLRKFAAAVRFVAFLKQPEKLLIGRVNGRVDLIDMNEIERVNEFAQMINDLSDGLTLSKKPVSVSGHTDGHLKMWNTGSGDLLGDTPVHQNEIFEIDIHEPSNLVASCGADGRIVISDLKALAPIQSFDCSWGVRGVTFSPCGELLAGAPSANNPTELREGTIDLWNVRTGQPVKRLVGHTNWVIGIHYFDSGSKLATLSVDGTVRIWTCQSGKCLRTIDLSSISLARSSAIVGNDILVVGHDDGSLSQWDIETGRRTRIEQISADSINGLCVSPDQDCLLASSNTGSELLLLEPNSFKIIAKLEAGIGNILGMRTDSLSKQLQLIGDAGLIRVWPLDE
jgi:serine/threonine protein kinase/WD40 repeat protein